MIIRTHPYRPARAARALLLLALAAACGDGTGPGNRPGIHLRTRLPDADTVLAPLPALELRVVDAHGKPAAGVAVELHAGAEFSHCAPFCPPAPTILLVDAQGRMQAVVTVPTDAEGIARARATLGTVAGPATLRVRVPSLGYEDTLRVTVRPGAPVGLALSPADTAVQVGRSYAVAAADLDRYGNRTPRASVGLSTVSPHVSLQGSQVTGTSFGRVQVTGTAGGRTATARVSVVPAGTVAATRVTVPGSTSTVLMGLDGSGATVLASAPAATVEGWSPDGTRLLMVYDVLDQPARIFGYHVSGGTTETLLDLRHHPRVHDAGSPRYSPDGRWIWFSGYESAFGNSLLWRMRPDGSELALVTPGGPWINAQDPDLSPDGTRLVYSGQRGEEDALRAVMVMDVASGTHTRLVNDWTARPRWSPTGEWIAFGANGRPYLVRPDGTGYRALTAAGGIVEWSPDGRYLLVQGGDWSVVDVATGEAVPIPASVIPGLVRAVWRPVP